MRLTPEQRRVLSDFLAEANRRGASPKERKALIEAGLVEANLGNPRYGDRDSLGSLQQRPSQGWGSATQVLNPRYAASKFLSSAKRANRPGMSAGELAQAVQRSAFPGRYDERSGQAESLLSGRRSGSTTTTTTVTTPGVDRSAERQSLLLGYLDQRNNPDALLNLASGLKANQDTPGSTRTVRSGSGPTARSARYHGPLFELFWQGQNGINVKNGERVPQGFVSGHTDHVHVAAGRKMVVRLGQLAQKMGLNVGENPHYGGVNPVHVQGSYHYKNEAIDVSGDPKKMARYAHTVARLMLR
jgi:hypothetical protein